MSIGFRYILFILSGALAGFISGLLSPLVFGLRGALLGGAISAGVALLNPWRSDPIGQILSLPKTLLLSALVGGSVFAVIWACHSMFPLPADELGLNHFMPLSSAISCLIYAVGILLTTRARLAGKRHAWTGYLLTPLCGALSRAWSFGEPAAIIYTLPAGALPFMLFWWLSALLTDPAWSTQRWAHITRKVKGSVLVKGS